MKKIFENKINKAIDEEKQMSRDLFTVLMDYDGDWSIEKEGGIIKITLTRRDKSVVKKISECLSVTQINYLRSKRYVTDLVRDLIERLKGE